MTKFATFAAAAVCALLLASCATPSPRAGLVIADVTIISPERAAPLEHAYVRIVDGRIAELSDRPLSGESEIDGKGRYLTPGLIDSHVHLAVAPGFPAPMTSEQAAKHPEIVAAALAQDPRSYLFHGFTTVIDLIGTAERTAQWNALELRPDAYYCGAIAVMNGQYRFALFPYFSYRLTLEQRVPQVVDPTKHTPEAIVGRIAADGAICVKTMYEPGVTAPTVEEARSLVAAAHARNLPVFIHANRKRAQGFAVAAGVDAIVHGMWREQNEPPELDDEALEILASIARDNIGYQPTTQVIAGISDMLRADYLSQPELRDVYPASLIDLYRKEGAAGSPQWMRSTSPAAQAQARAFETRLRGTLDRAKEVTSTLAKADAHLLFGSDTPSDLLYTNPPGLNARVEMNHWIAAGVSEAKLFRALTIDNARMLRLHDEIGTVEPGKTANLLLLRADPLRSVTAYDSIEIVFMRGRPIQRAALSARNEGE